MPMIDLSIIVVAYGQQDLLHATLDSVIEQTRDITYELIVVDNASVDLHRAGLQLRFPGVRQVRNERNVGYAAANNRGIRLSRGRYVVLLNPDTLLHDDALSALVRWMDQHPHVGAIGPQLRQPSGDPQPYSHGALPTPAYLVRRWWSHRRGSYLHTWDAVAPQDTDWIAGTCLVARREAIDQIGPLDERFFLYFEDVDWGARLRRAGWRVVFVPSIAITHIGGGSVGAEASPFYDRSLVEFYRKYYGRLGAGAAWLALRAYRGIQRSRRWIR